MVYDYVRKADLSKRDNEATIILKKDKIQDSVWRFLFVVVVFVFSCFFFQIEALLSLKNAWLPQILFLDTKSTC